MDTRLLIVLAVIGAMLLIAIMLKLSKARRRPIGEDKAAPPPDGSSSTKMGGYTRKPPWEDLIFQSNSPPEPGEDIKPPPKKRGGGFTREEEKTAPTADASEPTNKTSGKSFQSEKPPARINIKLDLLDPVRLGASAPQAARPGDEFTARFVAYTPEEEETVEALLKKLSPRSETHLDLKTCRWQRGTGVTVRLSSRHLDIDEPEQTFVWEGVHTLLDFDVYVPEDAAPRTTVLKFDVLIDSFRVAKIRLDLEISTESISPTRTTIENVEPDRSAFASYASEDELRVLDMVSVLRSKAGMDIFWDRASLIPGERWEDRLQKEIKQRDAFYLFWSPHARTSEWVELEWKTALQEKGLDAIHPQPLVPVTEAPPPEALQSLHFNDAYMLIRKALEGSS